MRGSEGGSRLAVITGPSGSGKSSLARAGVIARLEKEPAHWSVRVLAPKAGVIPPDLLAPDRDDLQARLLDDPGIVIPPDLLAPDRDDQELPSRVSKLVFVDQLEEWLTGVEDAVSEEFLESLYRVLMEPGTNILALVTLRADLLGRFLQSPLGRVPHTVITIGPMPRDRFDQVIEGPAAWADINFDADLVQQMINDTKTEDALPFLAFTLRELFEDCREPPRKQIWIQCLQPARRDHWRGGERRADVMAGTQLDEQGLRDLRRAFLKLADVQPDGSFVRRTATWQEIPIGARGILEKFIKARLVATGGPDRQESVWVIHDALFRAWSLLAGWLDGDREFRLWRKRVAFEVDEWETSVDKLRGLLRDDDLAEASKWLAERRDDLDLREIAYIEASSKEEARRRWLQRLLQSALVTTLILACLCAGVAYWFYRDADYRRLEAEAEKANADAEKRKADDLRMAAERNGRIELAGRLASQAMLLQMDYEKSLLLAAESVNVTWSEGEPVVGRAMFTIIDLLRQAHGRLRFRLPFTPLSAALSSRGERVAVAGAGGSILVRDWNNENPILALSGNPDVQPAHPGYEANTVVAISQDGKKLAVGGANGRIRLWTFGGPISELPALEGGKKPVFALAFSPDGRHLASGGADGRANLGSRNAGNTPDGGRRGRDPHPFRRLVAPVGSGSLRAARTASFGSGISGRVRASSNPAPMVASEADCSRSP